MGGRILDVGCDVFERGNVVQKDTGLGQLRDNLWIRLDTGELVRNLLVGKRTTDAVLLGIWGTAVEAWGGFGIDAAEAWGFGIEAFKSAGGAILGATAFIPRNGMAVGMLLLPAVSVLTTKGMTLFGRLAGITRYGF
jgi:hypothetical protein